MGESSKIEWTDASWTPIRARLVKIQNDGSGKERIGWHCEHVSEGCRNCYAERLNLRLGTGEPFKPGVLRGKEGYAGGGIDRPKLFLDEKMLGAPFRWKRPRMIFVCSMTDLFADFVPDAWLHRLFTVMSMTHQHIYQILTKRPARMREMMPRIAASPLPNVWLGTSVEDQATADQRIPELLATPAAIRFISYEPALGPVDLSQHLGIAPDHDDLHGLLNWIIAGGESGPGARPAHPNWFRSVRDQCAAAGVPFHFKQNGEWVEVDGPRCRSIDQGAALTGHWMLPNGTLLKRDEASNRRHSPYSTSVMARVGKKRAGRLLDGVEHNGFPA